MNPAWISFCTGEYFSSEIQDLVLLSVFIELGLETDEIDAPFCSTKKKKKKKKLRLVPCCTLR
jgi:hypothetical protein